MTVLLPVGFLRAKKKASSLLINSGVLASGGPVSDFF